jgi:hypothetical protein
MTQEESIMNEIVTDDGEVVECGVHFMQSPSIDKFAAAFAKAQSKFDIPRHNKKAKVKGVTSAGKSYDYEYSYADLAAVLDATRPELNENGIGVLQPLTQVRGHMVLQTLLLHESGEYIGAEYPIPECKTVQALGTEITYGRRYSLAALVGIFAEEDDDGAGAMKEGTREKPKGDAKGKETTKRKASPPPTQQPEPNLDDALTSVARTIWDEGSSTLIKWRQCRGFGAATKSVSNTAKKALFALVKDEFARHGKSIGEELPVEDAEELRKSTLTAMQAHINEAAQKAEQS